mgnify:CR=1 FL=1
MTENELATEAVDIAYQIHKELGPGLIESIYEEIFAYELRERNIAFTRQEKVIVRYKGLSFGKGFRTDLILDDKLIIELKSVEDLAPIYYKQITNYLRLTNKKLGILVNFNTLSILDDIKRIANKI